LVVVNSPDDRVRLPVMQYAQPNHIKRLRVVWVVRLRLLTTNPTRLALKLAALDRVKHGQPC